MPPGQSSEVKFEIGHVLFIDIIGYSKLLLDEQKERLRQLTDIVLATAQVREATNTVEIPAHVQRIDGLPKRRASTLNSPPWIFWKTIRK